MIIHFLKIIYQPDLAFISWTTAISGSTPVFTCPLQGMYTHIDPLLYFLLGLFFCSPFLCELSWHFTIFFTTRGSPFRTILPSIPCSQTLHGIPYLWPCNWHPLFHISFQRFHDPLHWRAVSIQPKSCTFHSSKLTPTFTSQLITAISIIISLPLTMQSVMITLWFSCVLCIISSILLIPLHLISPPSSTLISLTSIP